MLLSEVLMFEALDEVEQKIRNIEVYKGHNYHDRDPEAVRADALLAVHAVRRELMTTSEPEPKANA